MERSSRFSRGLRAAAAGVKDTLQPRAAGAALVFGLACGFALGAPASAHGSAHAAASSATPHVGRQDMLCFLDAVGPWSDGTALSPSKWECEDNATHTLAQLNALGWSVTGFSEVRSGGGNQMAIIVSR